MKLFRYMSIREFSMMSSGCDIVGKSDFSNCRTNSAGICFLGEETRFTSHIEVYREKTDSFETEEVRSCYSPINCLAFLSGIVSEDVLVEFEVENPDGLRESFGVYADPVNGDYDAVICITEYCIDSYNRDVFVPTRYAMVSDYRSAVWYDFN